MVQYIKGVIFLVILLLFFQGHTYAQQIVGIDTSNKNLATTTIGSSNDLYTSLLDSNLFLKSIKPSVAYISVGKKQAPQSTLFYAFIVLVLLLGITRSLYPRYFTTLFKVFFNTSLKQTQLTDQLNQASIPALIFNALFFISGGLFIAILIKFFYPLQPFSVGYLTAMATLIIAISYTVKYLALKFTGWVTQHSKEANAYIFIIFLINKVIGVFLIPVTIILSFSNRPIANFTLVLSIIVVFLLFFLRFLRSYSLLQGKLNVSRFHFLLYILCLEILPIALIYKGVLVYLSKNT